MLFQLEATTRSSRLPGEYNCRVGRCFQPMALHLLLLGGAGGRTGKWRWSRMAKNEHDQARSAHVADELLAL